MAHFTERQHHSLSNQDVGWRACVLWALSTFWDNLASCHRIDSICLCCLQAEVRRQNQKTHAWFFWLRIDFKEVTTRNSMSDQSVFRQGRAMRFRGNISTEKEVIFSLFNSVMDLHLAITTFLVQDCCNLSFWRWRSSYLGAAQTSYFGKGTNKFSLQGGKPDCSGSQVPVFGA